MRLRSFRLKLALASAALSGLVLAGFGSLAWTLLYRERLGALDRALFLTGERIAQRVDDRVDWERFRGSMQVVFGQADDRERILLFEDWEGRELFRSDNWPASLSLERLQAESKVPQSWRPPSRSPPPPPLAPPRPGGPPPGVRAGPRWRLRLLRPGLLRWQPPPEVTHWASFTVHAEGTPWRIGVCANPQLRLFLGANLDDFNAGVNRMLAAFAFSSGAALLLVLAGGWLLASRALRPINTITATAERITAQGLDQRIPEGRADRELARLTRVINDMLDRLHKSFQQAVRFSADASHELKTPLTVMQGQIEESIRRLAPGSEDQQALAALLEEVQHLKNITRRLLLLSRADAGQLALAREAFDLGAELAPLWEDACAQAEAPGLRMEAAIEPGLVVEADRGLVRMCVQNLLDNAIRYNEPEGFVSCTLCGDGPEARLTVCNAGPGIRPEDRHRLFDRFFRGSAARAGGGEGAGLGLALAREIARAHGGDLVLAESGPGRTCFLLRLPR